MKLVLLAEYSVCDLFTNFCIANPLLICCFMGFLIYQALLLQCDSIDNIEMRQMGLEDCGTKITGIWPSVSTVFLILKSNTFLTLVMFINLPCSL